MKRIPLLLFATLCTGIAAMAQIAPDSCSVEHKDSCWYVTFDYDVEKVPSNDGMLLITHVCNPDTCVSSAAMQFQGKKYAKRYAKKHGYMPQLHKHGNNRCVVALHEKHATDTLWGVTYSEYSDRNGTTYALDTTEIILPDCPSLSCHKVDAARTIADHLAQEHPHIKSISHYAPLPNENDGGVANRRIVRYRTNSPLVDVNYMQNAQSIDELMDVINRIIADSSTTVEAVQIVGYTSPEASEQGSTQLGYQRAMALRNHIRAHHRLPDSIFEVADGGKNWALIYSDIEALGLPKGNEFIARLKSEPSATKREIMLRTYENGAVYNELARASFAKHRGATINAIYYNNKPDSAAIAINSIINELIENPAPDYARIMHQLRQYKDDARAINLRGVVDYRLHHLHAAEKAFEEAAAMGDEQAALNLMIIRNGAQ